MQCARCANSLPEDTFFCRVCGLPKATNDAGSGGGDTSAPEPDAGQVDVPPGYTGFGFQEFNAAPAYAPRAGVSGAPGMVALACSPVMREMLRKLCILMRRSGI
jgi:hypothetical protein